MTTLLELSPEKINRYRATAVKRQEEMEAQVGQRRQKAWQLAQQAAQLLRDQFGVSRVVVFGSLVRDYGFTQWSDVDIAAWGISPTDTFRAIGAVMDLDAEIVVNLVDVNTARPTLLATIERDGILV
jgi:predicted nucleotidyltransferase